MRSAPLTRDERRAMLAAYLERRFDVARAQFESALALRPKDAAAREMLARMADLDPAVLPDDWDGVKTFETK